MHPMEETTASQSRSDENGAMPATREPENGETVYKVRHNKKEIGLTMPELLAAAEKGLDYDRIRPSHEFVKKLAACDGETDIAGYLKAASAKLAGKTEKAGEPAVQDPEAAKPEPAMAKGEAAPNGDSKEVFEGMAELLREYPEAAQEGKLSIPDEVAALVQTGMKPLEAYRLYDLKRTRSLCDELRARLSAREENRVNRLSSIGSLAGGDPAEKDFYTSGEWDRLSPKVREKFIRNGKIFDFMKKWSDRT